MCIYVYTYLTTYTVLYIYTYTHIYVSIHCVNTGTHPKPSEATCCPLGPQVAMLLGLGQPEKSGSDFCAARAEPREVPTTRREPNSKEDSPRLKLKIWDSLQ